jgi:hypothetical protein
MSERRNSRRVTFYCEAHLEGIDVSHGNVRLADLSVDGAFVDARTVLPPGAVARLRFTLLEQEVTVQAEVRYSMPGMGMGLRFVDLPPAAHDLIARFVDGH